MKRILRILAAAALIGFVIFAAVFSQVYRYGKMNAQEKADAIVVLGAAAYAGKPSPVYRARLDRALELYKKGLAPIVIASGGTHPGEKMSEGKTGKNYLAGRGIPTVNIIAEEKSRTTEENLFEVNEILKTRGANLQKILLVSDPFHMYRASLIAKKLGLIPLPSPTRTSPIEKNNTVKFSYMLRETVLSLLNIIKI